ncbi:MAG: hypothetical protein DYG98_07220 [Haliscomenobacteraceae bacterium CHB4]|nr:hypothetical protein [Saprospiraceae bacterium]MCE7922830.1 hypothetical protein [Haliscomenobacteraceae bacterium CHB4]
MLILLADTRKKLLWLWLGFTAVLVLLVFVQTLAGKYEGIEAQAWGWAFVQLLPALLLLFLAVLLNKNPSKVLMRATFLLVYFGALTYLLLVAVTLFALPVATGNWSIEEYLAKSYLWLVPFQIILLAAFSLLYFRKESLFRPNPAIMQQYVAKKAEFAQRTGHVAQVQAFQLLVGDNGLGATLEHLRGHLQSEGNAIVVLQNQHNEWIKQRDLNLLPPDALQRELNRLTMATIGFVEKM